MQTRNSGVFEASFSSLSVTFHGLFNLNVVALTPLSKLHFIFLLMYTYNNDNAAQGKARWAWMLYLNISYLQYKFSLDVQV